jgi:uncharacterized protein
MPSMPRRPRRTRNADHLITTLLAALLVGIGLVGVIVPLLPGLLLVWAGIAVWAFARQDAWGWGTLALVTVLLLAGSVIKYLLPGRRLKQDGVPGRSLLLGGLLGVVGFFVLPVVGLFVGFVLGIYLSERARLGEHPPAWASTRKALVATGWSILIELATGLAAATVWVTAAILG